MNRYKSEIAVIIPCYNEATTIAETIVEYKKVLPIDTENGTMR